MTRTWDATSQPAHVRLGRGVVATYNRSFFIDKGLNSMTQIPRTRPVALCGARRRGPGLRQLLLPLAVASASQLVGAQRPSVTSSVALPFTRELALTSRINGQ